MVNVTRDVSLVVLKIHPHVDFGDDYQTVAPHFQFFAEETARDFKLAQSLAALREFNPPNCRRKWGGNSPTKAVALGECSKSRFALFNT